MAKLLVTAYANPDIDRAGCMIAYAEFLTKTGTNAVWGIFGVPQREPQFVYTYLKITPPVAALYLPEYQNIVIVDGSDIRWIPPEIPLENIVEVIDHRKQNDAQKFTNAMIQIELVGAAATLIVEKYIAHNLPISYESALFVYAAIISNTINFKADVTTDRDRSAAQWLLDLALIPL
jgi:inorganic pyrophosphatase/exopolyphosphatase